MKKILIIILLFRVGSICALNNKLEPNATVTKVVDGNTIEILTVDNEVYKVMFNDVDSPELGQEFGEEARKFTEKMLLKKKVIVEMKGKDMWGNRLAAITLKNGKNIEIELLEAGYAWHNKLKSKDANLAEIEKITKEKKVGLWSDENPTAPWIFRRQQTMTTAKSR